MNIAVPQFKVRLAKNNADLLAAQALRYQVFVTELGGDGPMVDHSAGLESDTFDAFADHMLLLDVQRPEGDQIVGVYRLMQDHHAIAAGRYYSSSEFDLGPLLQSGRRLLELGRSCLHVDYRGGPAMFHLWNGLADYVQQHQIAVLFGVASFHGTDLTTLSAPLTLLHERHLAPTNLRVRAHAYQSMDLVPHDQLDRRAAVLQMPALIKAYLRLGGCVGDGAFVDHEFNTTDVCLIMDTAEMNARQKAIYTKGTKS